VDNWGPVWISLMRRREGTWTVGAPNRVGCGRFEKRPEVIPAVIPTRIRLIHTPDVIWWTVSRMKTDKSTASTP